MKIKYFILLLFIIACKFEIYSQAPRGELSYRRYAQPEYSLMVNRTYGDFWFGARAGFNSNLYFGTLEYSTNNDPGNPFKRVVVFDNGDGGGSFLSLLLEYIPINELWGYGLNINLFEKRAVNATSVPESDSLKTYYDFSSALNYIVVSPYARYNFLFPGLHMFTGLDVAINNGQETKYQKKFVNSGNIEQVQVQNLERLPISVGFHLGFGYDIFVADIGEKARSRFTPFLSLHLNSSMISDNSSTWSSLQLKLGMSVKFGFDKITYDTIKYDKERIPLPAYIAAVNKNVGTGFEGFRYSTEFASAELKFIEQPQINEEIAGKIETKEIQPEIESRTNIKFNLNEPYRFSFPTSASTDLTAEVRDFISELSNYLKSNPNFKVTIIGYSDNAGTFQENDERSRLRAEKTRQEFRRNGISNNRISITWRGSLGNIVPNTTEEGRRQNRRVEIIITR